MIPCSEASSCFSTVRYGIFNALSQDSIEETRDPGLNPTRRKLDSAIGHNDASVCVYP
jgi:hypothetical protein